MNRVSLNNDVDLSRIIYGMWRLGDDEDTSTGQVQAKIEACLAQGITSLDQADIYGGYEAEEVLGHTLKKSPALRDQIEIVTKCDIVAPAGRYADKRVKYYDTSRAHILSSVDTSLKLMNIDQIDVCLCTVLIHSWTTLRLALRSTRLSPRARSKPLVSRTLSCTIGHCYHLL